MQAPWKTYSSATDAPVAFGQSGQQFAIEGAGADLYSDADAYSSIYQPGVVGATATVETEVTAQQNMTGYAKAGIMVRNDITGSGTSPEGVILFESPSGGIQLEWDNDGGDFIDSVTPANGTIPESLPVYLELVRNGSTYTGYYSYDGESWLAVGSATVTGQAATQDAGMFLTSHAGGPARAGHVQRLHALTPVPPRRRWPPRMRPRRRPTRSRAGRASRRARPARAGRRSASSARAARSPFNGVSVPSAGTYQVTIAYLDGSATGRQADVSVNGGTAQLVQFTPTGSFSTVGTMTDPADAGRRDNTIEFSNPSAYAPDFDRIIVGAAPS